MQEKISENMQGNQRVGDNRCTLAITTIWMSTRQPEFGGGADSTTAIIKTRKIISHPDNGNSSKELWN